MNGLKKHRGLKRYYKNLAIENDLDKFKWLDLDNSETWRYDWHLHFDWYGYGNNSFKRREPHLDKLFRHFNILIDRTKNIKSDFQLYSILLDFNSSSDALFFHTPIPNNTQFLFKISDLQLTTTLKNNELNNYINALEGYEKLYGKAGEAFCLLFKKDLGQPF
ncbi:hypothetical protein I2I05_10695 [Hymenobacter sp. BT683]|uniref:Uncharacterized protein n=1 Tax=Hymenobacter jeongseonensis TaxID=2791027 RepID=A0ABS0IHM6_9BACT|nr:hypothetical protein [Hymenobacter jeongseonensis]MBF9237862.1 hypothetical protein [Hymenobacter jeongseonensis]